MAPGDQRTQPVELFFDLVFVFAVTRVAQGLHEDLTWAGAGRALVVLALVWWAWSAYAWVANAHDVRDGRVTLLVLLATGFAFFVAVLAPHALQRDSLAFVSAYAGLRVVHLLLYRDAERRGHASFAALRGFTVGTLAGLALLLAGALAGERERTVLWCLALALDYAGPFVTRGRLRELQALGADHFAERFSLFLIIALGESVVDVGAAAAPRPFEARLVLACALCLLIIAALWWTYFEYVYDAARHRLARLPDAVSAARDAYSYLHLPLVAGVIVFAVGAEAVVAAPAERLAAGERGVLCGGVALYLLGHVAFRLRMVGTLSRAKLAAAAASLAPLALGASWRAWEVAAALAVVLVALNAAEARGEAPLRRRVRAAG